jgi:hypothetical protein
MDALRGQGDSATIAALEGLHAADRSSEAGDTNVVPTWRRTSEISTIRALTFVSPATLLASPAPHRYSQGGISADEALPLPR